MNDRCTCPAYSQPHDHIWTDGVDHDDCPHEESDQILIHRLGAPDEWKCLYCGWVREYDE